MASSGSLRARLKFQQRALTSDGYGNVEGDWVDEFTIDVELLPRTGGEVVLQERLAGRQLYRITMRYSDQTAEVTAAWRAIDSRDASRIFSIVSPGRNPDMRRRWIEIDAYEGANT